MSLGRMQPKTQYVRSGDVHIAYQVAGKGSLDIVYVPGWLSHVELAWELTDLVIGFERLSTFARLILLDKCGMGLSASVTNDSLVSLEARMGYVIGVMES